MSLSTTAIAGIAGALLAGWFAWSSGEDAGYRKGFGAGRLEGTSLARAQCAQAMAAAGEVAAQRLAELERAARQRQENVDAAVREMERQAQADEADVARRVAELRERVRMAEARARSAVRDAPRRGELSEAAGAAGDGRAASAGVLPGPAADTEPTALEVTLAEHGERVAGQFRSCYRWARAVTAP